MGRKKNNFGIAILVVFGGIWLVLSSMLKELGIPDGAAGTISLIGMISALVWWFMPKNQTKPTPKSQNEFVPRSGLRSVPSPPIVNITFGSSRLPDSEYLAHWVPSRKAIQVGPHNIDKGLVYFFQRKHDFNNNEADPSAIIGDLAVGNGLDISGNSFSYWPSYSKISPDARNTYLKWLSEGAKDPNIGIGYVFIYFYGLERRAVVDCSLPNMEEEAQKIEDEVRRLRSIYRNGSFDGYSGQLLAWLEFLRLAQGEDENLLPDLKESLNQEFRGLQRLVFKTKVGKYLAPEDFLIWFYRYRESVAKWSIRNKPDLMLDIVKEMMEQPFPLGIPVTPVFPLEIQYRAASLQLTGKRTLPHLPDPNASMQDQGAFALCRKLESRLSEYSRQKWFFRSRSISPVAMVANAPRVAWAKPLRNAVDSYAKAHEQTLKEEPFSFVKIGDICSTFQIQFKNKLSKKDFLNLSTAHFQLGFGLDPDPVLFDESLKEGTELVVYKNPKPDVKSTAELRNLRSLLKIAAAGAWVDGNLAEKSGEILQAKVNAAARLSDAHKARISAYVQWLLRSPHSITAELRQAKALSAPKRKDLARLLVSTVATGHEVGPKTVKFLQKAYENLGFDSADVFADIHSVQSGTDIQKSAETNSVLSLDPDVLKRREQESHEVSNILSDVFQGSESENSEAGVMPDDEKDQEKSIGSIVLRPELRIFLEKLGANERWTREDADILAREQGLFLSGALEQINEWAFDHVGQSLADDAEEIVLDSDVKQKLFAVAGEGA